MRHHQRAQDPYDNIQFPSSSFDGEANHTTIADKGHSTTRQTANFASSVAAAASTPTLCSCESRSKIDVGTYEKFQ